MATIVQHRQHPKHSPAQSRDFPWLPVVWIAVLWAICYAPILGALFHQWHNDDDMGHGFFVPLFAGYLAWQRRDLLMARDAEPNRWGLVLLTIGAAQMIIAVLGAELFLQRTAFLISIVGSILYVRGTYALRVLRFPLALLLFMVPVPGVLLTQITFPLQLLASRAAEESLRFLGYPVFREGNILEVAGQQLSIVEACSGLRSLLSLTFASIMYAYLVEDKAWLQRTLVVLTPVIAIVANAGRIVLTGVLGAWDERLAEGVFHSVSSWMVFVIALVMVAVTHSLINTVYEFRRKAKRA